MARNNSPLAKKFFIWRGMLANTKTQATAGSSHSNVRASAGDSALRPSSRNDVNTRRRGGGPADRACRGRVFRVEAAQQQRVHHVACNNDPEGGAYEPQLRPR